MNPFTEFLSENLGNRKLRRFINDWDTVEKLVIDTFRQQGNLEQDRSQWQRVRARTQKSYSQWREVLKPYWQQSFINGQPVTEDPFLWLLNFEEVSDFHLNWQAMQTLPPAREALNKLLLEAKTRKGNSTLEGGS